MESIFLRIVFYKKKLRRRLVHKYNCYLGLHYTIYSSDNVSVYLKAMAEKIERMEIESESKDKVSFLAWFSSLKIKVLSITNYLIWPCDQQLGGIQELYNSQQKLSQELSEKLDKTQVWLTSIFASIATTWREQKFIFNLLLTQKKLEDTENQLLDLEERYRQAKCTIREKEYLIVNLLQSGL